METVLVTGATGAARRELHVIAACREASRLPDTFSGTVREGVDIVCHCAAWTSL
jgi:hypothetical protein